MKIEDPEYMKKIDLDDSRISRFDPIKVTIVHIRIE